jgi:single-stranded-DNA-specific exonuclease
MSMNESIWILTPQGAEVKELSRELGIPMEIAQILANRNIHDAESAHNFLYGDLDGLHDPFLMSGMKEAVERVRQAIFRREKILIFGDYDVDGVLSVVMLFKALESLGAEVDYFIPDRLKEGYGIKEEHAQILAKKSIRLVISVDCGIKATQFVKKAKEMGVDVIITDHHRPGPHLPEALAILNPVLEDSGYPDKDLAGVGVVFKLIQALSQKEGKTSSLPHYLKLVSIGTIADVVALRGENRLFAKFGMKGLDSVSNLGLRSLIEICGLRGKRISEGDIGFRIGPRINAAGRMGMTNLAVRLFFSQSLQESMEIVRCLDELNSRRQTTEERIYSQALLRIHQKALDERYKFLILGCEEWHRGVIGIVASKLKDYFHRPVILFVYEDRKAHGSGRSIPEFPLIDCLDKCKDLFLSYGGHTQAIGCILPHKNMESLKQAVNAYADAKLRDEDIKRKIVIDTKLDFENIHSALLENFFLLFPFGVGNPKPIFLTERAEVASNPQRLQGKHLKLLVKQKGRILEALGWEKAEWAQHIQRGDTIDLAYSFQFSEYLGEEKISLNLEDLRKEK